MSASVSAARLARLLPDTELPRPAYRSLARALRTLLADGALTSGTRLPSERDLTLALGCSRTTVTRAYAVLREDGFLTSRRGSGSRLALPDRRRLGRAGRVLTPSQDLESGAIDLTCAATRAPAGVAEAFAEALAQLPAHLADNGYAPVGLPELRAELAAHYARRGLPTSPDQILVTSGAVAGLAMVGRALLRPGSRVLVEAPTYPNGIEALLRSGARLTSLPVDPHGWDLSEAERIIGGARAELAYLIPDFHNPTGALLDAEGRERLAAALDAAAVVPIVDETIADVDLALDGDGAPPLPPPFAAFSGATIALGSAAKSFWGGLRIGWVRMPPRLAGRLLDTRATLDLGAPIVEQLALTHLLRRHAGMPESRRRDVVAARDATVAAVRRALPDARFVTPRGGLSLWVELAGGQATEVTLEAAELGLLLAPGPRFGPAGGFERFVRIPYVHEPEVMTAAVERLAAAVDVVAARESEPGRGRPASARSRDQRAGELAPAPFVA